VEQSVYLNNGEVIEVDVIGCPFCGSQPKICHIGNNYTKSQKIQFKCPECRIERKNAVISHPIKWCLDNSVKQWNMREE
jgi:transposase-like protein